LGKTGIKVSQLSLGTNNFGSQLDEESSIRIIKEAVDLGINSIDGADVYAGGKSEQIIGNAIRGDRGRVVLATKVAATVGGGPNDTGLSRKHIVSQVDVSLKRLQTDYIDLYYMHRFDPETPLEETLRTFDYLMREGKILYLACSNFAVQQIRAANEVSERLALEKVVAVQLPYNIINREIEREVLPLCYENQLGLVTYSPLMGGFLTGKYKEGAPAPKGSRPEYMPFFRETLNKQENYTSLNKLLEIAQTARLPPGQIALQWVLKNPAVTSVVVGASSPEQVEDNCRTAESKLSEKVLATLDEVVV
jgi:aryl-alcohol dehydrogenase-like predicted oxidoreductase